MCCAIENPTYQILWQIYGVGSWTFGWGQMGGGNPIWLIFWKIDGEESWTREVRWLKTHFTKCYGKSLGRGALVGNLLVQFS